MRKYTFLFLFAMMACTISCIKDTGEIPPSVNNVVTRHAPEISLSGGGGGGGAACGSVNPSSNVVTYRGIYSADVQKLLSKVSGWRTPSGLYSSDAVPPKVAVSPTCSIRDAYVSAAVGYAWGAEGYYRLCEQAKAEEMANLMKSQLQMADDLCTRNGPGSFLNLGCATLSIYDCQ